MARAGFRTRTERELPETIRRQIGTAANRRYLSRLPGLALQRDTSDELERLLGELDAAERETNRRENPAAARSGLHPPASGRGRSLK